MIEEKNIEEKESEMIETLSELSIDDDTSVEDSNIHDFMEQPFNEEKNDNEDENSSTDEKPKRGRPKKVVQEPSSDKQEINGEFEIPDEIVDDDMSGDNMYYNNVYDTFKDLGIITNHDKLEEGKVLTNDELVNILDEEKKIAAQKIFEDEILSKFSDPDAQEYLKYVLDGGSSKEFFRQKINAPTVDIDGDISDDNVQNKIISKYLKTVDNLDDDEINETLEMLTDSGKKEKYAQKYYDRLMDIEKKQKDDMLKQKEYEQQQQENERKNVIQAFANELNNTDEIFGMKYDKNKKNKMMNMLFQNIKLQDGTITTEYQYRLNQALSNPKTVLIIADLLMNGLDYNNYSKSIETKVTRQIRNGLDSKPLERKRQTSPFDNLFK